MSHQSTNPFDRVFFQNLVTRQIRQDYLENVTGFAWLVLQPLLLLSVYAFVFTHIFQARIPGHESVGFVPYLAVAFWPWTAFSEAILKASGSITSNAALVSKVAFAREQLPLATVTATFLMHMAGFAAVLVVLALTGTSIQWLWLPLVLPVMLLLWLLACAIALFVSSTQVFLKDMAQILPPVMTFWFFMSPILYSPDILPEPLGQVMQWNPITWFAGTLRAIILGGDVPPLWVGGCIMILVLLLAALGLGWFRRFSGHFEDFL